MPDHEPLGTEPGSPAAPSADPSAGDAAPPLPRSAGRRRGRKQRSGCLPILLVLAVVAAAGYGAIAGVHVGPVQFEGVGSKIKDLVTSEDAEDYPGPGSGRVLFTVSPGDSLTAMGENLEAIDVVASGAAFVDAAEADGSAGSISEGVYRLQKQMKASAAVDLLVSRETKGTSFTFTSGKTSAEVLTLLAKDTGVSREDYEAALAGGRIGLPADADPQGEGYLSPGSYTFFPDDDATTILKTMVARTEQTLKKLDVAAAAERLDYSVAELVTVASLVEAEGSLLDEQGKARIARVIYNRLADPSQTAGLLQLDATVNYARGEKVARPSKAQIQEVADNPYNTYTQAGLPPGPIATPSGAALEAASAPARGDWLYYVTVDLGTGETKFTGDYDEFLVFKGELDDYCDTSDRC